jgi:hypothetical protein
MPKERNATYEQQCDVIPKLEYLQLQVLLVILDDTNFFCEICEDLKDPFVIGIQSH